MNEQRADAENGPAEDWSAWPTQAPSRGFADRTASLSTQRVRRRRWGWALLAVAASLAAFGALAAPALRSKESPEARAEPPEIRVEEPRADAPPSALPTAAPQSSVRAAALADAPTSRVEHPIASSGRPAAAPAAFGPIAFELGNAGFSPGDDITIESVVGDRPSIEVGGTYRVTGAWTLGSHDGALIALYATDGDVTGSNQLRVERGGGRFELEVKVLKPGYLHVSFYPRVGSSFGGVYFGTGTSVYRGGYVPGPPAP